MDGCDKVGFAGICVNAVQFVQDSFVCLSCGLGIRYLWVIVINMCVISAVSQFTFTLP